ncbi:hypothetical protein DASB73_000850 [Starmerella bacillaris]|uniref:NTF2 domain-containing protein n=1 Tax=Starmerella bacillaris TaxID=1247836 RepID=A0AAV5RD52_STABA|nr:hypothetical protein DASB73_000850 [Starmerella bacillaris]
MSNSSLFSLLDVTVREGKHFSSAFFRAVDSHESPDSVTENTTLVWNGSPLLGSKAFHEMLLASPVTKHDITGFDVQPFPNGDQNAINMIVSLSGRVYYGDKVPQNLFGFSAQLVVRRIQPNSPLALQTMSYRLIHKPSNATLQI